MECLKYNITIYTYVYNIYHFLNWLYTRSGKIKESYCYCTNSHVKRDNSKSAKIGSVGVCKSGKKKEPHLTHYNSTIDGQLQVCQTHSHHADDPLHSIHFLTKEDVHWVQSPHLHQSGSHLNAEIDNF